MSLSLLSVCGPEFVWNHFTFENIKKAFCIHMSKRFVSFEQDCFQPTKQQIGRSIITYVVFIDES